MKNLLDEGTLTLFKKQQLKKKALTGFLNKKLKNKVK